MLSLGWVPGVFQGNGEFFTSFADLDFFSVELHSVVGFDSSRAVAGRQVLRQNRQALLRKQEQHRQVQQFPQERLQKRQALHSQQVLQGSCEQAAKPITAAEIRAKYAFICIS